MGFPKEFDRRLLREVSVLLVDCYFGEALQHLDRFGRKDILPKRSSRKDVDSRSCHASSPLSLPMHLAVSPRRDISRASRVDRAECQRQVRKDPSRSGFIRDLPIVLVLILDSIRGHPQDPWSRLHSPASLSLSKLDSDPDSEGLVRHIILPQFSRAILGIEPVSLFQSPILPISVSPLLPWFALTHRDSLSCSPLDFATRLATRLATKTCLLHPLSRAPIFLYFVPRRLRESSLIDHPRSLIRHRTSVESRTGELSA